MIISLFSINPCSYLVHCFLCRQTTSLTNQCTNISSLYADQRKCEQWNRVLNNCHTKKIYDYELNIASLSSCVLFV